MVGYTEYKTILTLSLILIVTGLILTAYSLFSPLWQIADLSDSHHEHGLWWDCVISSPHLIPLSSIKEDGSPSTHSTYSCSYKFDESTQNAIRNALESSDERRKEVLLHRFLPQHKAVLFFGVFTFLFGLISIVIGVCSPCFPPNSLLYVVAIFMTAACSLLADVIFIFAAQRKDPKAMAEMFQHRLGLASLVHMGATVLFGLSLLFSVVAAYLLISCGEGRGEGCCARKEDFLQSNTTWRPTEVVVNTCDRQHCKPFIVVNEESSQ